jgi:cell division protease FtsH
VAYPQKTPPDEPGRPREEPPPPRRRLPLILLVVVGIAIVLFQSIFGVTPRDTIRYDELLRYVRDGRVEWVQLSQGEIVGGWKEGRPPPARRGEDGKLHERESTFVTGRVDDDDLVDLLEEHDVAFRQVEDSRMGETWPWLIYLGLTLLLFVFLWGGLFRRIGGQAGGVLAFGKSKGKVVQENEVDVTFDDVAGVDEAKEELLEIISFLDSPEKYRSIGAKIPKGVLLVGPPGTGKTLLARAVAGEAAVPFISISGSEFVEMFVGVGAARVRDLFDQAAKSAPCIVFIDELDALGRSRGASVGPGSNEEREQTLNQLLVEMDGFEPNEAVIIMAATNRPEILDPALLRAGRFDRQVLVDRPDRAGREAILRVHVRGVKLADDVDLTIIAARTPGFAGADLANLVNEAALLAARREQAEVTRAEFSDAIDRVVAGLEKKNRLIGEEEKKRVAYHEVGHALTGYLAGGDDEIHKISIVPRGISALGYTMQLPTEERYLMTESDIRAKLVGLLGGRAAEEVVFGESSTGAQNDLQKATQIARAMVVDYGMSERVGPVSVARSSRPVFLAEGEARLAGDTGQTLADTIDEEVRRIVEEARARATKLLRDHRAALERIAQRLLEKEVLEGPELAELLAATKRRDSAAAE